MPVKKSLEKEKNETQKRKAENGSRRVAFDNTKTDEKSSRFQRARSQAPKSIFHRNCLLRQSQTQVTNDTSAESSQSIMKPRRSSGVKSTAVLRRKSKEVKTESPTFIQFQKKVEILLAKQVLNEPTARHALQRAIETQVMLDRPLLLEEYNVLLYEELLQFWYECGLLKRDAPGSTVQRADPRLKYNPRPQVVVTPSANYGCCASTTSQVAQGRYTKTLRRKAAGESATANRIQKHQVLRTRTIQKATAQSKRTEETAEVSNEDTEKREEDLPKVTITSDTTSEYEIAPALWTRKDQTKSSTKSGDLLVTVGSVACVTGLLLAIAKRHGGFNTGFPML